MSSEPEKVEPPTDYFINHIINVFELASRSRPYSSGMAAIPLPLSTKDITNVVEARPVPLPREVLDTVVFEIDNYWLMKNQPQGSDSK